MLVSRVVAWQLARQAVWKEHERTQANRVLFSKVEFITDRPLLASDVGADAATITEIKAGELRWYLQVEDLFFRFYARPPTDVEKEAVKTAFVKTMDTNHYPPLAWVVVLCALLSSQEFWHI